MRRAFGWRSASGDDEKTLLTCRRRARWEVDDGYLWMHFSGPLPGESRRFGDFPSSFFIGGASDVVVELA